MKKKLKIFFLIIIIGIIAINIIPIFSETNYGDTMLPKFDVIIVLGNPANNDCKPAQIMTSRVNEGIKLYLSNYANKIIYTGGNAANNCIEADVMADYSITKGIPDTVIIRETNAQNTYQNAYYSVKIMNNLNFKSAAIITSDFHIKRASNIFANYNISYRMFEAKIPNDISFIEKIIWHFRENIILTYHSFFGYSKSFGLGSKNHVYN